MNSNNRHFLNAILILSLCLFFQLSLNSSAWSSETIKGAKKDFQEFKEDLDNRISSIDSKMVQLKSQMKQKGSEVKDETLKDLQTTREKLRKEYEKFENASSDSWSSFKKSLSETTNNLNDKIQKALSE